VRQRLSHPANYRSRSAFKLLELDSHRGSSFLNHPDVRAIVDLGAAPGGWSQVVAGKFGFLAKAQTKQSSAKPSLLDSSIEDTQSASMQADTWSASEHDTATLLGDPTKTIVALDLLPISPIPGVHSLQMDFLSPDAESAIRALLTNSHNLDGKADVVLSDMAANATGNRTRDVESSLQICEAAFEFCRRNLRTARDIGRKMGGVLVCVLFSFLKLKSEVFHPTV
jgi:23S rRNA (uridine2552-2'-O)-methyltransferase